MERGPASQDESYEPEPEVTRCVFSKTWRRDQGPRLGACDVPDRKRGTGSRWEIASEASSDAQSAINRTENISGTQYTGHIGAFRDK